MTGRKQIDGRYGKMYSDKLTKEYLKENYTKLRKSPYQIAADIECSPRVVYNYLDYHKIKRINFSKLKEIGPKQTFGLLTTVCVDSKSKNGTKIWKCQCHCGNIVYVPTSRLKNGRSKSCGCWRRRKKNHFWKGYCDVSGNRISEIRLRAKKKNMAFDLTAQFLWELYEKQNKKCKLSNLDLTIDVNASVDRIDSSLGYTMDNVQWVHRDVNKMKMDLKLDTFLEYCNIISNFNKKEV